MDPAPEKIRVSRIIPRPDKIRVVRSESNLPMVGRMLRSSALRFLTTDLEKRSELDPEVDIAYRVAAGILDLLQEDTHAELIFKSVASMHGGNSVDLITEPFKDMAKLAVITDPRDVLFLLMSNCFNRADELAETAFKQSDMVGSENLGLKFLEKVRIAEYKESDGQLVRVNFSDAIKNIQVLAQFWGIDSSTWNDQVKVIVNNQLKGVDLIRRQKVDGYKYSGREAMDYRQDTVGRYTLLLGEIAFGNKTTKIKALHTVMMLQQFHDDCFDVLEDVNSQVNPVVAFLDSSGLMDSYLIFAKKISVLPGATGDTIFNAFFKTVPDKDQRRAAQSLFGLLKTQYLLEPQN